MIYTCASCNRELVTRRTEATEDGRFPDVVPYVAVIRNGGSETANNTLPAYCCADCATEGPGKFQANGGRHDIGIAKILHAWSMESGEDDYMTSEGWGYCGQFGRFLLMEDTSGFVTFEEYRTTAEAQKEFDKYYSAGWGANEDDAYISEESRGYSVSFEGKHIGTFERMTRAKAAVSLAMRKSGYFPSVWVVNERGSIDSISVW